MPCYFPLKAYKAQSKDPQKTVITFRRSDSWRGVELKLPCGQCIGCRLERSRQWAVRCVHEASLYDRNSFLTLTYSEDNLPRDLSLDLSHFQLFMKRLRKSVAPKRVRFYHCGEYGETTKRPHYHALLFGHDFEDKKFFSKRNGNTVYTSDELSDLWKLGHAVTGDVTFDSAAYVARYVMKKVTGKEAEGHYNGRKPEYTTMSRRPGIGTEWFRKYSSDVTSYDWVVVRGVRTRVPRFYDSMWNKIDPAGLALAKINREKNEKFVTDVYNGRLIVESDSSDRRLDVKNEVKTAEISRLIRPLEG